MNTVRRFYVEQKEDYAVAARELKDELRSFVGITNLEGLRILDRYDVQGIKEDMVDDLIENLFTQRQTNLIYKDKISHPPASFMFSYELLPGQFDLVADSCIQCARLISKNEVLVKTAKTIILSGDLSKEDYNKVVDYIINPIESRLADEKLPTDLEYHLGKAEKVEVMEGFILLSKNGLVDFHQKHGFAMSIEDLAFTKDYFMSLDRDPTITELKLLDTYWSDHCRHTTFNTILEDISFEQEASLDACKETFNEYLDIRKEVYGDRLKDKPICLMDMATIGAKYLKKHGYLEDLEDTKENNACSIRVDVPTKKGLEKWLIMFKNETHNHPTEIEPFGGAATCLGGAIRDPLSGRSYVYQAMRITGAGNPFTSYDETLAGKLPQIKIIRQAADGYSSYGNQIGISSGFLDEIYHDGYVAKRMELGAVIAASLEENVLREDPQEDDVVILIGGRTGRDGLGGATGSSKGHTEDSLIDCGAQVQKGNAPLERRIQRLFRNPQMSLLIKKSNDFGAGGVAVAIGELADGLDIYLDKVPTKYEGLDGTEIALSESQERMAVVVDKKNLEKVFDLAQEENLEAVHIANITASNKLRMFWQDDLIVDIDRSFLDTNGVTQKTKVEMVSNVDKVKNPFENINYSSVQVGLRNSVSDLNSCSKEGLTQKFDSTVGANTVLFPLGGKNLITPIEAMASKIPMFNNESDYATLMAYGYFPQISQWSTYTGAIYAVLASASKILAAGGNHRNIRLSFQEYFESLRGDPKRWGKPTQALLGALHAQLKLKMPSIGGKDSMSGSFNDMDVPPTLVSFAVSHTDSDNVLSPELKGASNPLVIFKNKKDKNHNPDLDNSMEIFDLFLSLNLKKALLSASTVKNMGVSESLLKMAFGNMIGINFELGKNQLFENAYADIIAELDLNKIEGGLEKLIEDNPSIEIIKLGESIAKPVIIVEGKEYALSDLLKDFRKTHEEIFSTTGPLIKKEIKDISYTKSKLSKSSLSIAKPRVFIPVFPGTNGEDDARRAFEREGAICTESIFRNMTFKDTEESIEEFVRQIKEANIIVLPGGFSLSSQSDGSGKFIQSVLQNEYVKEAIHEMLYEKDGLMLGICNGFQALVKSGLLPYGQIGSFKKDSPTFTSGVLNRHVSTMVQTKVVSKLSPWFSSLELGDIHTVPYSNMEGRFVCTENEYDTLRANGQIATVYVDDLKEPTYDIRYNPSGSFYAVEALTSPDGRILGKMAHSERSGKNICKNVPGDKNQRIFESGLKYFK